jgi:hypothetical protein
MRFCKHCGFALDSVKDLLAPPVPVKDSSPGLLSIRVGADQRSLRGLNQSAYLLLLSFVPIVLAIAQGVFSFTLLPPLLLIKAFYVLLAITALRFGYAIYEAKQAGKSPRKAQAGMSTHELVLPNADSSSVKALGAQPANSSGIIRPPSITEHTTKLLSKSETDQ